MNMEKDLMEEKDILALALRLAIEDMISSKDEVIEGYLIEAVATTYITAASEYLNEEDKSKLS